MAQIGCARCTKAFKTETGYLWHIDHLHPNTVPLMTQDESRLAADEDRLHQSTVEYALAETATPEIMGEEDQIGELLALFEEVSDVQQQMVKEMAQLRREFEQVKDTKVVMEGLRQDVASLKNSKGSLDSRLSRVIKTSDALASLVSYVDIKLKPKEFADVFVEGLMPEDLKEARHIIRSALGTKFTRRRG